MISPLVCLTSSATLTNVRGRLCSSLCVMRTMERDWLTRKNYHREAKDEVRRSKYEGRSTKDKHHNRTSSFVLLTSVVRRLRRLRLRRRCLRLLLGRARDDVRHGQRSCHYAHFGFAKLDVIVGQGLSGDAVQLHPRLFIG